MNARTLAFIVTPVLMLGCSGARPDFVGKGTLAPCPSSPNCVSTSATDQEHGIAPMKYDGAASEAMAKLVAVVRSLPRTKIVAQNESYLYVEFTSKMWRFVDDVEFVIDDAAKTIQFRSASRLGKGDFGVNRKRMEEVRRLFAALAT